jgi:hypothetical protein
MDAACSGANAKDLSSTTAARFTFVVARSDLPKFASSNRTGASDGENKAVVQGSLAYFGSYTVDEAGSSCAVRIESSTFPNSVGTSQQRRIIPSGSPFPILQRRAVA